MNVDLVVENDTLIIHFHIVVDPTLGEIVYMLLGKRCVHHLNPIGSMIVLYLVVEMDMRVNVLMPPPPLCLPDFQFFYDFDRSYEKKRDERSTRSRVVEARLQRILELTTTAEEKATIIHKEFREKIKNIEDVGIEMNPLDTTTMPTLLNEIDIEDSSVIGQTTKPSIE